MTCVLTPLMGQEGGEHGGTELELHYNDFFTATFRSKNIIPKAEDSGGAQSKAQSGARSKAQSLQVLLILERDGESSANELAEKLGLQSKTGAFKRTLQELLAQQQIEYTIPGKPSSRLQQYRLTESGRVLLQQEGDDE